MQIRDLKNKLTAILGFGQEGEATARYLLKHGIQPVLFDQRPWQDWEKNKQDEIKALGINFIFGPDAFLELAGFDVAFRSPGVQPSKILNTKYKMQITSQTRYFFANCPAKIIGVTGTKGKGTTTSLIFEILKRYFQFPPLRQGFGGKTISNFKTNSKSQILNQKSKIYLTGNIGYQQPLDILDDLKTEDFVVFELSSFQLQDLEKSPHLAVVLMTTSEHLDYHKNDEEYINAKSAITKFQESNNVAIINEDYPVSIKIGQLGQGKKIYISGKKLPDFIDKFKIHLRGEHNLENIAAAAAVATVLGIDANTIKTAVENFKGLEHRLEFVGEKSGIKFYNDSFSTTPETAMAAIKSFFEPLIIILGGSKKYSDFTKLGQLIAAARNIKAIILVGEEAGIIKQAITSFLPRLKIRGGEGGLLMLEGAKNMEEIFGQVKSVAAPGDVVLLSPACASFDIFKSYEDRGEQFIKYAEKF